MPKKVKEKKEKKPKTVKLVEESVKITELPKLEESKVEVKVEPKVEPKAPQWPVKVLGNKKYWVVKETKNGDTTTHLEEVK